MLGVKGTRNRRRFLAMALSILTLAGVVFASSARAEIGAPEWVRAMYVPDKNIVGLAWKLVPGATGYQILRSTTAGSGHKLLASIPGAMYVDKDVEPGVSYYYVLRAMVGKEEGPLSKEKGVSIPGTKKVEVIAPEWSVAKGEVRMVMGQKKGVVSLVWQKPAATNIVTFNVYRKGPKDTDFQMLAAVNDTKYADEAVEIGKTYAYSISSVDDSFTETEKGEVRNVELKDVEVKTGPAREKKILLVARGTKVVFRKLKGEAIKNSTSPLELEEPFDIVMDEKRGLIYTSSTNTRKIDVFNDKGEFVRYIGQDGGLEQEGVLIYPLGLAIDASGRLYVADGKKNDIQIFDHEGKILKRIVLQKDQDTKETPQPKDVAVDKDGVIYALDSPNGQVQVFDPEGRFKFKFSKFGAEPGQLRFPNYLIVSNDGERVYVANSGQAAVSVFTKDGKYLGQWGGKKNDLGKFVFIAALAQDKKGRVFVSDLNTGFIQAFTPDGQYLFSLSDETTEKSVDVFAPRGLFIDSADRIYATEGMIGRISVLQMLENFKPAEYEPQGNPIGG